MVRSFWVYSGIIFVLSLLPYINSFVLLSISTIIPIYYSYLVIENHRKLYRFDDVCVYLCYWMLVSITLRLPYNIIPFYRTILCLWFLALQERLYFYDYQFGSMVIYTFLSTNIVPYITLRNKR